MEGGEPSGERTMKKRVAPIPASAWLASETFQIPAHMQPASVLPASKTPASLLFLLFWRPAYDLQSAIAEQKAFLFFISLFDFHGFAACLSVKLWM